MKTKLPKKSELVALIKALKKEIASDYRSTIQEPGDSIPMMDLTIGADSEGNWSYQTGDNSYAGGAYSYPYWAVVYLDRRCNSRTVADDILSQLSELMWE